MTDNHELGGDDPRRLGYYEITGVPGKGAQGALYDALDRASHRRVLIQTMKPPPFDSNADANVAREWRRDMRAAARALVRLTHPNIMQVLDVGEEPDVDYIVLEFISGSNLKALFDASVSFETKEAVRIMSELLNGLHIVHEAGIIHRDVKPANVVIDANGRVMLTDFFVARLTVTEAGENMSDRARAMVGTPAYMAPEVIMGALGDRRRDIFSAGVILFQFLRGRWPFSGEGAWTVAKKIVEDDPPPPSSINTTLSPLFDEIVNKAVAKNPENRYQTAREMGLALQDAAST